MVSKENIINYLCDGGIEKSAHWDRLFFFTLTLLRDSYITLQINSEHRCLLAEMTYIN